MIFSLVQFFRGVDLINKMNHEILLNFSASSCKSCKNCVNIRLDKFMPLFCGVWVHNNNILDIIYKCHKSWTS